METHQNETALLKSMNIFVAAMAGFASGQLNPERAESDLLVITGSRSEVCRLSKFSPEKIWQGLSQASKIKMIDDFCPGFKHEYLVLADTFVSFSRSRGLSGYGFSEQARKEFESFGRDASGLEGWIAFWIFASDHTRREIIKKMALKL